MCCPYWEHICWSEDEVRPVADLATARAAKRVLQHELASANGINGVGLSRRQGDYTLTVGVADERSASGVPHEVRGVPVQVKVVGRVTAS